MANIVGEWKFDELTTATEGTPIQDSWGRINDGILDTYVSTVDSANKVKTGTECISGNCLSFDGIDDYVYVSGSDVATSNLAITGAITLSAWVKLNEAGGSDFIMGRGAVIAGVGNYGYTLTKYTDNKIHFYFHATDGTTTGVGSLTTITDTNWHYFVGTWDGTTSTNGIKLYIDGALDKQGTSTVTAIGQPVYQFRMGINGAGLYILNGSIDDVRVYNLAIPSSQIKEQYYARLNKMLNNGSISKKEYEESLGRISIK